MTTVANMPVGPDSNAVRPSGAKKDKNSNHPGFLGTGMSPNSLPPQVSAGQTGPNNKSPNSGAPSQSAAPLMGGPEKAKKNAGTGV